MSLPASDVLRTNFNRDIVLDVSDREIQVAEGYLPIAEIFSAGGAAQWALEWAQSNEVDRGVISQFLTLLNEPMRGYEIPAILLDKETTVEAVTTVFEKVNQGGMELTVFELLTAKFAGDRPYFEREGAAFRLRRDWERIRDMLDEHPVLEGFDNDDFLQAVTLASSLHGPTATTARKEDVLKLRLESYLEWSPRSSTGSSGPPSSSTESTPTLHRICPTRSRSSLSPSSASRSARPRTRTA